MNGRGKCRGCGADILWSMTEKGKAIPVDPEPVLGGNLVLECFNALARVVKPDPRIKAYRSHFATCPEGIRWRKP
jgi:hypothetical protein